MFKHVAITCVAALAGITGLAHGTESLGLQGIISGKAVYGRSIKRVDKLWANTRGGEILCTITHANNGITEQVRVRWSFARDVTTLRAGEAVKVTLRIDIPRPSAKKHPSRTTNWFATAGGGYGFNANLVKKYFPTAFSKWGHYIDGSSGRVYARPQRGVTAPIGYKVYTIKPKVALEKQTYCSMAFSLNGYYDVVYMYRVGSAARRPEPQRTGATYELYFDGRRVGRELNYSFQNAVNNLLINRRRYPNRRVTARYGGVSLNVTGQGYELFWNYRRVGYEPRWSYSRGLSNLRWNIRQYPKKQVTALYNGRVLRP